MSRRSYDLCLGEDKTQQSHDRTPHNRFIWRRCTQRHCDHLSGLKPVSCDPNERRIERDHVACFLKERVSQPGTKGYWEIHGQPSEEVWVTLISFKTFELLIQPPSGQSITLGNLDLAIILETCLEDAGDNPFVRKLASMATCWPAGFARFRWMIRGTMVQPVPCPPQRIRAPGPRRLNPLGQRVRTASAPQSHLQTSQGHRRQSLKQRASSFFTRRPGSSSSPAAGALRSADGVSAPVYVHPSIE